MLTRDAETPDLRTNLRHISALLFRPHKSSLSYGVILSSFGFSLVLPNANP